MLLLSMIWRSLSRGDQSRVSLCGEGEMAYQMKQRFRINYTTKAEFSFFQAS